MDDAKVWTVRVNVISQVMPSGNQDGGMVFIDGVPHLVLEWCEASGAPSNEWPSVTVELNPKNLEKLGPPFQADFLYQQSVEDPRQPS